MNRSRIITLIVAMVLAVTGYIGSGQRGTPDAGQGAPAPASSSTKVSRSDKGATITKADLPVEARRVIDLIRSGGPFPYDKDGSTFGNFEKRLPARDRGYYREYTVPTPGASNRGARRIVAGGPKTRPNEMFYTQDHYESFRLIEEDVR